MYAIVEHYQTEENEELGIIKKGNSLMKMEVDDEGNPHWKAVDIKIPAGDFGQGKYVVYKGKLFCTFLDQFWLINIKTSEVEKLFDFDPWHLAQRKKENSTVYHLQGDNQLYVVGGEQKNALAPGYCFTQVRALDMDNLKTSIIGSLQKARRNPGVIKI